MKPKSLQTSVCKRGARAESFLAFWSFSLAIGARKSFSRFYVSHYPILGRFFNQFEVPIERGETVGPGALRGRGMEGKGRGGGGGANHRGLVPEIVPE